MRRKVSVGVGLLLVITGFLAWRSCGSASSSKTKPSASSGAERSGAISKRSKDGPIAPASITGRVTRSSDGAGIAGAIVSIAPAELMAMIIKNDAPTIVAVTDANGVWKAPRVRPGAYVVAAAAKGYLPASHAKLTVGSGEERGGVNIVMHAGGTVVSGIVSDVGGGPIGDARVTANRNRMADLFARADFVAITNAEGRYELTLPEGDFELEASHDDYQREDENVEVAKTPVTVDFKLVPGAVIRGQVIARDSGQPVPGALVRAEADRGRDSTAIADEQGNFALRSLGSGQLELHALGRGYASATATEVAVGIGEQVEGVRIMVDRAYSISGRVVRKADKNAGLPGITLGAFSITAKSFGLALEPSTDDGSFEIVGLKRASYMLFAVGEGSVPEVGKNVEIVDKDVTGVIIELDTGVTLAGRVEPPTAGVQMSIESTTPIGFANMFEAAKSVLVHGETDAAGVFTLRNVPRGAFNVKGAATDGRAGSTTVMVAAVDQSGLVVKLEPRGSISGRVVDTSGKPAGGVHVGMTRIDDHNASNFSFSRQRDGTTTSPDGSFNLVGLDAGKYRVKAYVSNDERFEGMFDKKAPASKAQVEVDVAAAAAKTGVTLTIEARDGVIQGVVMGPDRKPAADAWVTAHRVRDKVEGMPAQFSNRRWGGSTPVLTNADGQFAIRKLRRGTYDLVVEGPRGASHAEKPGVKTGDSTTIQLLSLGTLSGKVTLGGAPVTKYEIECKSKDGERERQVEAKDGAYTLERMAPGSYQCEVESEAGTATAKVDVGATPTQRDFALTKWATITGVVVSVLDKKPVPGVMVFAGTDYSEKRFMSAITGNAPKTDANGRFSIPRVAVGKGKAVVLPTEGFQPLGTRDYTVAEGQRVDVGTIEIVPPRTGDAGTFGLSTSIEEGKLLVASVKDGGPAALAGVAVGDRITAVNGRDVATLTPPIAALLLSSGNIGVGQRTTLSLERGGTPMQVSLVSVKW